MEKEKNLNKYGQAFQLTALSLFFKDKTFTNRVKDIIRPEYFDNKYTKWFCEQGLEYLSQFSMFPSDKKVFENFKSIIDREVPETSRQLYNLTLNQVEASDLSDRSFVEREVENFCLTKHALLKCKEQENNILMGNFDKARELAFAAYKPVMSECEEMDLTVHYREVLTEAAAHKPMPMLFDTFNKNSKGGPGSGDLVVVCAASSLGKCFSKGTKIRMFDNSIKNIEDIVVGDKVMGWDGKSRTVTSLAKGEEEMYEVEQSHGNNYTVNQSHILCLKPSKSYQKKHPNFTSDIVKITVSEYLNKSLFWKKHHYGFSSLNIYHFLLICQIICL